MTQHVLRVNFRYYYDLIRGKTKALKPAKLDLKHMWAVLQSYLHTIYTPTYKREQIIWRRGEIVKRSPKCWEEGACVQCGCIIIMKTMADMECEDGCYPYMMSKGEWKQYKIDHNIKLFD